MDEVLHMQFERVEAALATLVDSIATYNPSPQAALDLVTADDELAKGLDQRTLSAYRLRLVQCSFSHSLTPPSQPRPHPRSPF